MARLQSLVLPILEWRPDAASYLSTAATIAKGTYPRSDDSDGPLQGPVVMTSALAAACRGGFTARDKSGTSWVFAGTQTKLYVQNGMSWTDRSGATYAVPTGQHWRFCQFGERVIATNYSDELQTHTLASGSNFADLNTAAPKAKYIAAVEPGFVMLGFYDDGTVQPNGVWWSGINDATLWPTPGTTAAISVQSDNQQLPTGGAITGIVPSVGGASAIILTERAVYRTQYTGGSTFFSFVEVDRSRGCIAPQSVVQIGPLVFFLSEDGFCAFDGVQTRMIGAGKVDEFFLRDLDQTALERVYGTVDYARKLIIWAYPSTGASSQTPNRWMVYSYATDRWRWCDDSSIAVQYLFPARSAGYTLDGLDTPFPGGIDSSGSFSVDSPLYQGGVRVLAGFDTSNRLVSFNGANLAARLETGDADVDGNRIFVRDITPLTDCQNVQCSVGWRNNLYDVMAYTTPTSRGVDNRCPQRVSARFVRVATDIPAGAAWTRFQGVRTRFFPDGQR